MSGPHQQPFIAAAEEPEEANLFAAPPNPFIENAHGNPFAVPPTALHAAPDPAAPTYYQAPPTGPKAPSSPPLEPAPAAAAHAPEAAHAARGSDAGTGHHEIEVKVSEPAAGAAHADAPPASGKGLFGALPIRNPFAGGAASAADSAAAGGAAAPASTASSGLTAFGAALRNPFGPAAPTAAPAAGPAANGGPSADVTARLRALEEREAALTKREAELRAAGVDLVKKNWPPCYPILHHDIAKDIPPDAQRLVWLCYLSWLGLALCFTWGFICACGAFAVIGAAYSWLWAIIYLITGVPCSLWGWYLRYYKLAQADAMLGYMLWFLFYAAHICFSFIAFVAPFSSFYGIPGIMSAMSTYNVSAGLGTIYWVGAMFWGLEALFSTYVFMAVYRQFRGRGGHEQVAAASKAGGTFMRFT